MKTTWRNFFALGLAGVLSLTLSACGTTPPKPGPDAEAALAVEAEDLSYSNKWRIEVSEGARSTGEMVFQITPRGGQSQLVTVPIARGTRENNVAKAIKDVFENELDEDLFHVERDDGEDVLVKKRHDSANFSLRVISSTVEAVRIRVQKE
ncbi:MAG: hypothetical protein V2J20_07275 [Wenzhouxiangella sp.]|jgi:hypothetical protein|nr:hypothetical protein [Wenzhouxiangella sp.]